MEKSVKEPTRANSCLDLFFTNRPSLVKRTEVVSGISHHAAVLVKAQAVVVPVQTKKPRRQILLWSKADMASVCRSISDSILDLCNTASPAEEICNAASPVEEIYHSVTSRSQESTAAATTS